MAALFLAHGCVSSASLRSQGDAALPVRAARTLPGAPQVSLGSCRDLDHTGL